MRMRQEESLRADLRRWAGSDTVPAAIDDLLKDGWTIRRSSGETVARDWHTVIAIAFMDELKNNEPARAIFDSSILAELKNRDERLAPISNFEGFELEFGKILPVLTRIEDKLEAVADTGQGTKDITQRMERMLVKQEAMIGSIYKLVELQGEVHDRTGKEHQQQTSKNESSQEQEDEPRTGEDDSAFRSACELLKQGDLNGSRHALDNLISRLETQRLVVARRQAAALSKRGQIHEMLSEWDQAVTAKERAVENCPDDVHLRWDLAQLLAKQKRFEAAIDLTCPRNINQE